MAVQNIALIGRSSAFGANAATTPSLNTTGATLLVVFVSATATSGTVAITDSNSNSWTALTTQTFTGAQKSGFIYATNPTVGAGHTFTATLSGGVPSMQVLAFTGVLAASPFDVQNGAVGGTSSSTLQPGSITPSVDGELVLVGMASGATFSGLGNVQIDYQISSIYTNGQGVMTVAGTNYGTFVAWAVQHTAAATNPTFTLNNGSATNSKMTANIASFKAAAAASGGSGGAWAFA